MDSSDDSSFNFSLTEEVESGEGLKSAVDQLVGSNQKNDSKTQTPLNLGQQAKGKGKSDAQFLHRLDNQLLTLLSAVYNQRRHTGNRSGLFLP